LREGWYLMSVHDLEIELARHRGEARPEPTGSVALSIADALAFRDAGNVPDELGRSLRLVLHVSDESAAALHEKRLDWEPDFHDAPDWRGPGSMPVNVVPLRVDTARAAPGRAWWDDPELAALEKEWEATGVVAGVRVPAEYRGFVYKTVLSLQQAGRPMTVDSLLDSVARWLNAEQVEELRRALAAANG
jgi:hypothetical protein